MASTASEIQADLRKQLLVLDPCVALGEHAIITVTLFKISLRTCHQLRSQQVDRNGIHIPGERKLGMQGTGHACFSCSLSSSDIPFSLLNKTFP